MDESTICLLAGVFGVVILYQLRAEVRCVGDFNRPLIRLLQQIREDDDYLWSSSAISGRLKSGQNHAGPSVLWRKWGRGTRADGCELCFGRWMNPQSAYWQECLVW